jgi:uncharacterized coiled-coil DUF342 family protein
MPKAVVVNEVTGLKAVKYDGLFAPLIEAIKELHAQLSGSEKKIQDLNREVASLKERERKLEARLERLEKVEQQKKP